MIDVVVYGGTPGGIAASISAAELGCSVLLLEPTAHLGGMATEGGIGLRDALRDDFRSNPQSSQYRWGQLNAKHYNLQDDSVIWQPDHFVGEQSFLKLLTQAGVELLVNTNFVEGREGIRMDVGTPSRIQALILLNGTSVEAKYYIDASYEGELMIAAGVDSTSGREPSSQYSEPWGGVTNYSASKFPSTVNPFGEDGWLLPYISYGIDPKSELGQADENLMAYSYRVCLTKDPSIAVAVTPPHGYIPEDFELARRVVLSHQSKNTTLSEPWIHYDYIGYDQIPGNTSMKYDACCGLSPVGIDAVGLARGYANASRTMRLQIAQEHRYYVQGLLWFWRTDPSVPEEVRQEHLTYGLCGNEWVDNDHFPRQLYVREASRLVGDRVFNQNDRRQGYCRSDSIAVGEWGLDVHDMQRVAYYQDGWKLVNEGLRGSEQDGVFPFEIPYWVILPKRKQLANLAVVNTPSVSHVAFSAIRVEPILWTLGQAAGTAVAVALNSTAVNTLHDVNVEMLQDALMKQGVVIHWPNKSSCDSDDEQSDLPVTLTPYAQFVQSLVHMGQSDSLKEFFSLLF